MLTHPTLDQLKALKSHLLTQPRSVVSATHFWPCALLRLGGDRPGRRRAAVAPIDGGHEVAGRSVGVTIAKGIQPAQIKLRVITRLKDLRLVPLAPQFIGMIEPRWPNRAFRD
jgi:hypothetical protein